MRVQVFVSRRFDAQSRVAQLRKSATHLRKGAYPNHVPPTSNVRPASCVTKPVVLDAGPARTHVASVSLVWFKRESRTEVASRVAVSTRTALLDNSVT